MIDTKTNSLGFSKCVSGGGTQCVWISSLFYNFKGGTRWAPTNYKCCYNPYKWPKINLTQPMDPEKKSLNFIFPTKYVIPKSLKFSHWPSKKWIYLGLFHPIYRGYPCHSMYNDRKGAQLVGSNSCQSFSGVLSSRDGSDF